METFSEFVARAQRTLRAQVASQPGRPAYELEDGARLVLLTRRGLTLASGDQAELEAWLTSAGAQVDHRWYCEEDVADEIPEQWYALIKPDRGAA